MLTSHAEAWGSNPGGAVILQAINKSLDQFNKNSFPSGFFTYLGCQNEKMGWWSAFLLTSVAIY